jgi:hypothetical protein
MRGSSWFPINWDLSIDTWGLCLVVRLRSGSASASYHKGHNGACVGLLILIALGWSTSAAASLISHYYESARFSHPVLALHPWYALGIPCTVGGMAYLRTDRRHSYSIPRLPAFQVPISPKLQLPISTFRTSTYSYLSWWLNRKCNMLTDCRLTTKSSRRLRFLWKNVSSVTFNVKSLV